jgi:hypothetical protein
MDGSRNSLYFIELRAYRVFNKETKQNRYSCKQLLDKAFPSVSYSENKFVNVKGTASPYNGDVCYWSQRESKLYDRITDPNLNISSIVVDRASAALCDAKGTLCARILENETIVKGSTQSASAIELLCIDDESIEDRDNSNIIDVVESNLAPQVVHIEAADLTCIELSTITLRQARKIAKQLGIKQKVNGKDVPKDWLVKQIEQKLPEKPDSNKIISELLAA